MMHETQEEFATDIDDKIESKIESTEDKKFKWTKDRIVLAVIFSIIILVSIALLVVIIVDKDFLFTIVRDYFVEPLEGLHLALQILIFLGLMILQSLFAPIPSELILLASGIIFGIAWGSVIGLVGSMLSAAVTFYISKRGGRSIVDATGEKVGIIKRTIYIFDEWIKTWGLWAIIIGRAVPVIMFDPISYAAGLSNVKDKHYFLATFIGSIPRAIFYSFIGVKLLGEIPTDPAEIDAVVKQFNIWFFVIFGILVFMFVLSNVIYYLRKRKEKKEKELIERNEIDNELEKELAKQEELRTEEEEDNDTEKG